MRTKANQARIDGTANLRVLRERASLSQIELARLAGIAPVTVARVELGINAPRLSTIQRLITVLGVRPQDLFD